MNDIAQTYRLIALAPDGTGPRVQGHGLSQELAEFLKARLECACDPGVQYLLEPERHPETELEQRWRRGLFNDGDD